MTAAQREPVKYGSGRIDVVAIEATWRDYGGYIVAAGLLLVIQAASIAALATQRSRSRDSEARNEAILHAIPDMMFLMSRDGTYRDFHAADQTQLLLLPEQFIGRRLRDVLPRPIADMFETRLAQLTPRQVEIVEYALAMPDGERQFEARLTLTRRGDVLAIVRDVTAPKRADALLLETQTELNRVSRLTAIGEFSASLAHEVRQPLTAILMNARACLRMLPSPAGVDSEVRAGLLDIVEASQRAEELVRRNQELFQHHTVQAVPLNINSVVVEALSMTAASLREWQVDVHTSLPRNLPQVKGDRIELEQVMLNLLTNAIDALKPLDAAARQIDVTSRLGEEGFVEISVSDRGVGLGGVDLSRMFELSYTTKKAGSGVGLSVSRAIVLAHGGQIWAGPGADGGARFSFTVPIARRPAEPATL